MQIPPALPPVPKRQQPELPHLAQAEESSKSIRDEVVNPLRQSVAIAGVSAVDPTAWRAAAGTVTTSDAADTLAEAHLSPGMGEVVRGLGVTGSALGGVLGLAQLSKGLREGKAPLVLSGVTELTISAATLAALGLVPGAAALVPVGAGLLGIRSVHDIQEKNPVDRVDGWRDMVTSSTLMAAMLKAPAGLVAVLGTAAAGFNLVRGLTLVKQGHDCKSPYRDSQGTGAVLAGAGAALLASGVGLAPGIGLLVVGIGLPLLERLKATHKSVDAFTAEAVKVLYPLSLKADALEDRIHQAGAPLVKPLLKAGNEAWESAPMAPVRHAASSLKDHLSKATTALTDRLAKTRAAHLADEAYGKVATVLAPPAANPLSATSPGGGPATPPPASP